MPTGHADRLMPALRRVVLVRETADRTDGQLLTAFVRDRDGDAFAVLVRRHGPMVLGVCRRVVGDAHAADDALQAVFLVLARRAAAVRPREQVGNWLYGVAYRTAIKARAVLARRRAREKQVETMPDPPAPPTADPWADLHPVLDEELARLPDKLRLPVVLCDLEGRPQRAVAKHLGIAPATLAARLASARRLLAGRLTRRGVTLSGGALAGVLGQRAAATAVPPALAETTVRAAEAVAAGAGVTGLVSAHAVHLCEGVLRMMMMSKLKAAGASALAVLVLTGGLGFGLVPARAGAVPGPAPATARKTEARPAPRSGAAVDEFVLDKLAALDLTPASGVDDATFLRRLYLDLAGTLPTPVESGYFVADGDAGKRRKVADWLLTDDGVRAHLAKRFGVPAEQVRLAWAADPRTGRVLRLAVVQSLKGPDGREAGPTTLAIVVNDDVRVTTMKKPKPVALAFTPDGEALAVDYAADKTAELLLNTVTPQTTVFPYPLVDLEGRAVWNGTEVDAANVRMTYLKRLPALKAAPPRLQTLGESDPPKTGEEKPAPMSTPAEALRFWYTEPAKPGAAQGYFALTATVKDSDEAFLGRAVEQARGVPPTAVERKYFLEDKDPKKREKLLDLLLKDPVVAKKLGDAWKKKMLEPAATAVRGVEVAPQAQGEQLYTNGYKLRLVVRTPQPDRLEQLVGELIEAKKTDEQVLEAVTLATVRRLPTAEEKRATLVVVATAHDRQAAWVGLAKALGTSDEAKKLAGPTPAPPVPPAKP